MESQYLKERRARMLGLKAEAEKPVKKIASKSEKRKVAEKEYLKMRKVFLIKNFICQVKGCKNVSEDVHHKRGRVGDLLTDEKYFMAVCRDHHTQIESDPTWAKENGFSLSRLKV